MFILILRTCVIAGSLQPAGTTLQVADNFVLNGNVKAVAAPVVPVVIPVVIPTPIAPASGSVRLLTASNIGNTNVPAGTILPPGTPTTATRTTAISSNGSKGTEQSLVQVFTNGVWTTVKVKS